MPTVIMHIQNEDPVVGEIDDMPTAGDTFLLIRNPRRRDGKDISYLDADVNVVIWPINRINFVEIIPSGADETIITHVRE